MKNRTLAKVLLSLALPLLLSACVVGVGNRPPAQESRATVGQNLLDLQRALEAGAISDAEFEQQKMRLIQ